MKGFIRIIEIIIIILAMFVLIIQFFNYPQPDTDWNKVKLGLLANDIASSFEKLEGPAGWFDSQVIDDFIENELSMPGIMYNVEVVNDIKRIISVGCACSDEEYIHIGNVLKEPVKINGEDRSFELHQLELASTPFSEEYDVIVLGDEFYKIHTISSDFKTRADRLLDFYGGIVAFADSSDVIVQNNLLLDSVPANDYYSLDYDADNAGAGSYVFDPSATSGLGTYNELYELFIRTPVPGTSTNPSYIQMPHRFEGYVAHNTKASKGHSVLKHETQDTSILSANIWNGRGRVAWLSAKNKDSNDIKTLLKSAILWASRHRYHVVRNEIPGTIVSTSRYYYLERPGNPMPQNIEVIFSAGYIY